MTEEYKVLVEYVSKKDWEHVYSIMLGYKRTSGWVAYVDAKITFFDSKPLRTSLFVTIEEVEKYINSY